MFSSGSPLPGPPEIYNARVWLTGSAIAWAAVLFGYDSSYIGTTITLPAFKRDYGLNSLSSTQLATTSANIVSTFQLGAFGGAALGFPLMESLGRKRALQIATVVFLIGSIVQTVATTQLSYVYSGRVLVGLGVGTITSAAPVFLAEISPAAIRGRLVGLYEISYQIGAVIGFWLVYGIKENLDITASSAWRIPTALQLVPSGLLFLALIPLHETPRYLMKAHPTDATLARASLAWLRNLPEDHPYVQEELEAIRSHLEDVKSLQSTELKEGRRTWWGSYWRGIWRYLSAPGMRNRLAIGFAMMLFQNMVGTNAINYYSPSIFKAVGVADTYLYTGIFGLVKAAASVIFLGFLVDRVGRRPPLLLGGTICFACMLYVGIFIKVAHPQSYASPALLPASAVQAGKGATAAIFLFGASFAASWNGLAWIICSELFPLKVRAFCGAFTAMAQWLFQFIIARTTPNMVNTLGWGMFVLFAGFCAAAVLFAYFFVPELSGMTLEEMDELFGFHDFSAHPTDLEAVGGGNQTEKKGQWSSSAGSGRAGDEVDSSGGEEERSRSRERKP